MKIALLSTNSSKIAAAMVRARRAAGSPAMDMVMTLVVITDEDNVGEDLDSATNLSREHPSRVIGMIYGSGRGSANLDAKVRVGEENSGESILLRISGELTKHAESVVLPLLLPDSPVVVWWPRRAPANPSADSIGSLGQRRITDAESAKSPVRALRAVIGNHAAGDTDLAWTRLTPMRATLAAALDQVQSKVTKVEVETGAGNPAADLLIAWLSSRLKVSIVTKRGNYDHISSVRMHTGAGTVSIERGAGDVATFSVPGSTERQIPLGPRSLTELLAEELRRLDEDDVYSKTITHLLTRLDS